MIKTIIFDYGGVITSTRDHHDFVNKYYRQLGVEKSELLDIFHKDWHQTAINDMSAAKYWQNMGLALNIEPHKVKKMVIDTFPIEKRIIKLIDEIKDRYTLVMMSNQIEDWLEEVIDDNNLRGHFHYFINSYQAKISKPDKRIFLMALERTGSLPEETLFIDDLESNITSAKKLGIQTIKFETYRQFLEEFKKLVPDYQRKA